VRLVTYQDQSGQQAGVVTGSDVVPAAALEVPATTVKGILAALGAEGLAELGARAESSGERIALEQVALLAPVPDPEKIICLGLNYRDHALESGQEIPSAPMWFAKFANSLIGSGQDIVLPAAHPDYVDYEAELAVIIGRRASRVSEADALSHVAGATAFNDVSARDLQFQNTLWTSGKAIDTFAPCGPALVTLDEVGDLGRLGLRTRINGEVVQEGNSANLIFTVAAAIAWLSRTLTLEPGDIIATGTPAGIGGPKGIFLRDGDTVEVEVDGVGALVNRVRTEI
jgi:2-keto-4-pentenoate hydratase/2-oxohepta-3-ene-1,7-dioic acid hydratase in catechol pathway